jgi:PhzF family phenazine biosynthesis protein
MSEINVIVMNSFIDGSAGGNPAGVVFPADGLSPAQKQFIAARVGVPETAFISKSQAAPFKLEFFTPTVQIPHCGHATVASFCYLMQNANLPDGWTAKETIDGVRKILLRNGTAFMQQLAPTYTAIHSKGLKAVDIASALGLAENQLLPGFEPVVVHTGNSFLIVPVQDLNAQRKIKPDLAAIQQISEKLGVVGYYSFCLQTEEAGRDAAARMFAPRVGINEESATGTAAGPLAAYLYDVIGMQKIHLEVEQGRLMQPPSPSLLQIDLETEGTRIKSLMVGGKAIQTGEVTIQYN